MSDSRQSAVARRQEPRRPLYAAPPLDPILQAAAKPTIGVCRYCGCTESTACRVQTLSGEEGCHWVDKLTSFCSAEPCRAAHGAFIRRLMLELASDRCCCGRLKKPRETFCKAHYWLLSDELRKQLYRHFGNGYEEAYARARYFLLHGRAA